MDGDMVFPDRVTRKQFVGKLRGLRDTLSPTQRRMLDGMVAAAMIPSSDADVFGYEAFWSPAGPYGPGWYDTGWLDEWDDKPWGSAFGPTTGLAAARSSSAATSESGG